MARNRYTNLMTPPAVASPIAFREKDMVKGRGGGYVFKVDDLQLLKRFVTIGTAGNTYYASAREMTRENAEVVLRCAKHDPALTASTIADISHRGVAFRNDTAIFALALMAESGDPKARKEAFAAMRKVCRTASHFFLFQSYLNDLGGKWNRSRRNMTLDWYYQFTPDQLAYQCLKYQNRAGWAHRDLIRLGHVTSALAATNDLFTYLIKGELSERVPEICHVYETMKEVKTGEVVGQLIADHNLTWEFVPSQWLGDGNLWRILLPNLPYTAMLRNLARMTANGTLGGREEINFVMARLMEGEAIKKARIHPISILIAHKIYGQGKGEKGKLMWTPIPSILSAMDAAFYKSFHYVEPTGKRILIGLDVSSSMFGNQAGDTPLNSAEAASAMAMSLMRTEEAAHCMAFSDTFRKVPWSVDTPLERVLQQIHKIGFGRTDCSLPVTWATKNALNFDLIIILTDNETNEGLHVPKALDEYQRKINPHARFMTAAMVANAYSTADPTRTDMMDAIGFSADLPSVVSGFAKGEF